MFENNYFLNIKGKVKLICHTTIPVQVLLYSTHKCV